MIEITFALQKMAIFITEFLILLVSIHIHFFSFDEKKPLTYTLPFPITGFTWLNYSEFVFLLTGECFERRKNRTTKAWAWKERCRNWGTEKYNNSVGGRKLIIPSNSRQNLTLLYIWNKVFIKMWAICRDALDWSRITYSQSKLFLQCHMKCFFLVS